MYFIHMDRREERKERSEKDRCGSWMSKLEGLEYDYRSLLTRIILMFNMVSILFCTWIVETQIFQCHKKSQCLHQSSFTYLLAVQ